MLKRLIAFLSITTLIVPMSLKHSAIAKAEDSVCFLRMQDGRSLDLRKLCGKASPSATMMRAESSARAQSSPGSARQSINQAENELDDETQTPPASNPAAPATIQTPTTPQPGVQATPEATPPGSAVPGSQPIAPAQTTPKPAAVPVQRGATPSAIPANALPRDPNEEVR
ncbi:MAG: hypothetical protein KME42_15435 [Tildeniella nuda ZEHNDER 1965/U140]|nr:hypothetical protein [Tildeniella nuda ZEHNDER 1965/U140]